MHTFWWIAAALLVVAIGWMGWILCKRLAAWVLDDDSGPPPPEA